LWTGRVALKSRELIDQIGSLFFLGGFVALKIRLKRMGSNKKPTYRIVVLDSHFSGKGRRIEDLGTYNPRAKEESQVVNLKKEAIVEWVKKGAVATDTVQGILNKAGVSLIK
jgi:small subunit ribosomal protein S16